MSSVVTISITVLMVLFMLTIVVSFIAALISKLKTKDGSDFGDEDDKTSLRAEVINSEENDELSQDEIIAVLTAAVYASRAVNPDTKIQVRSFRRVGQEAPVWNYYGRKEQIITNNIQSY